MPTSFTYPRALRWEIPTDSNTFRFIMERRLTNAMTSTAPPPPTLTQDDMLAVFSGFGNVAEDKDLDEPWTAWETVASDNPLLTNEGFAQAIENITGDGIEKCHNCGGWEWDENTSEVNGSFRIDGRWRYNVTVTFCDSCAEDTAACDDCRNRFRYEDLTSIDGSYTNYCSTCVDDNLHYCEDCDEYHSEPCDAHGGCGCVAPRLRFEFPANGAGTIAQDERLPVTLPAGVVDGVGLAQIRGLVWDVIRDHNRNLPEGDPARISIVGLAELVMEKVGDKWQTKQGNMTRRLSREYYKATGHKLPDGVITQVGNLARLHSSDDSTWHVEFTRDLNLSAYDFVHEDSCWWGDYSRSRCALKSWGGLALRTFGDESTCRADGRAWVQPLDQTDEGNLVPTHRATTAVAFLVYNGYGDIDGYRAARIIGHLTSKSYKKIEYSASAQYVNGGDAFLIADESILSTTGFLDFIYDEHHKFDAAEIEA